MSTRKLATVLTGIALATPAAAEAAPVQKHLRELQKIETCDTLNILDGKTSNLRIHAGATALKLSHGKIKRVRLPENAQVLNAIRYPEQPATVYMRNHDGDKYIAVKLNAPANRGLVEEEIDSADGVTHQEAFDLADLSSHTVVINGFKKYTHTPYTHEGATQDAFDFTAQGRDIVPVALTTYELLPPQPEQ
jgi:hypothetical protein